VASMNPTLADLNPFMFDESVRFDESALMEAIETALAPKPEYRAEDIRPILKELFKAAA